MEEKWKDRKIVNGLDDQVKGESVLEPKESGNAKEPERREREIGLPPPEELQVLQDKYLRLAAEFENYKRIAQREQREFSRFANETLLKELLPIVDNLERAIECAKKGYGNEGVVQGVELTLKQFLETLSKFGVSPIATVGTTFNPARHQAITRVETLEKPDNTIIEELQKGYLLHDRVLRAATVTVATSPSDNKEQSQAES